MISVITITCRDNAGLDRLVDSLAECRRTHFEWILVDEAKYRRKENVTEHLVRGRFPVQHLQTPMTTWRLWGLPDPNHARNFGLKHVRGDYVVFLDDNMIVSREWLRHVWEAAGNGWGFRSLVFYCDPRYPPALSTGHRWEKVTALQCSGIFGAPVDMFELVGGFDEDYAGEMGYEDLDCIVKMEAKGLRFRGTRGSWSLHHNHPPLRDERKPPLRNQKKFSELIERLKSKAAKNVYKQERKHDHRTRPVRREGRNETPIRGGRRGGEPAPNQ